MHIARPLTGAVIAVTLHVSIAMAGADANGVRLIWLPPHVLKGEERKL
jgi:hypothetical protein